MPVAGEGDLHEYVGMLSQIGDPITAIDPEVDASVRRFVGELERLQDINRRSLAELISQDPDFVVHLASMVGLSQERLKRQLQVLTGSAAWVTRSREAPEELIAALDDEFGVVDHVVSALSRDYTLADVLIARAASRSTAGRSIDAGRYLEDLVQEVIEVLGLPFEPRTQFVGRGGETAPADFAIPAGGRETRIAIGVKGFGSTGSKLTAACDEVARMVTVRQTNQYLFAVVDGVGWLGRTGDLARLVRMLEERQIDGLFPLQEFGAFEHALRDAAVRVRLLQP